MTDANTSETIARLRHDLELQDPGDSAMTVLLHTQSETLTVAQITALLDAADNGARDLVRVAVVMDVARQQARDAALEEAAVVAENACLVPPDGGAPTDAEREMCEEAARQIRALRRPE
jgi:hypothetical protein